MLRIGHVCILMTALSIGSPAFAAGTAGKRNVVLIVVDDLNDFVTGLGGHPQARTPHIERLAQSGVAFANAYSNNPVCAPSRSSLFTGIYPHTSGNYSFTPWHTYPVLRNSKTLMEHFRDNGYRTYGSGKLMHHHVRKVWDEFQNRANYGPVAWDGKQGVGHPSVPEPFRSIGPIDGSFAPLSDVPSLPGLAETNGHVGWYDTTNKRPFRYVDENDRDSTPDEANAEWAAKRIEELAKTSRNQPFFLAVGFLRPHTPLHAPKKYFDMFPLESVQLPTIKPGDAEDCYYAQAVDPRNKRKGPKYFRLLRQSYPTLEQGLKTYVRAYLACVAFVDDQIGAVIEAVDRGPLRDSTIIVLTSDHGYNMGEKDYLFKNSLWEESTRVPLIVRAPGVGTAGSIIDQPVSLIDVYPTLADLCELKGDTRKNTEGVTLEGYSLKPLMQGLAWDGPEAALSVINGGPPDKVAGKHFSVRTRDWRYILYADGSEELYDHTKDPYEWTNLATDPVHAQIKGRLRKTLLQMTGQAP